MSSRKIHVGDLIPWDGRDHHVRSVTSSEVRLQAVGGDEILVPLEAFATGLTESLGTAGQEDPDTQDLGSLAELPEEALAVALARREHVHELIFGVPHSDPGGEPRQGYGTNLLLQDRIEQKVRELTDAGWKASAPTLRRWMNGYQKSGLLGLVDKRQTRGKQPPDQRLLEVCASILEERANASKVSLALLCTEARIKFRAIYAGEPVPSPQTFKRIFRLLGYKPSQTAASRRSEQLAPKRTYGRAVVTRPGEQVQIDSTPLDVLVLNDRGVAQRCTLSLMIDVATHTIMASLIRPGAPKSFDHCLLLAMALFPDHFRTMPPSLLTLLAAEGYDINFVAQEMPHIIPETITRDNGKDYRAATTEAAMLRYGIGVNNTPPYTPTSKPVVERTFGAINKLFSSSLPSYVGTDPANRGMGLEKEALPLHVVNLAFDVFVRDVWQQRRHDGLRDPLNPTRVLSPNQRFEALSRVAPSIPIPVSQYEFYELLPVERRVARPSGIEFNRRTYRSADLTDHINRNGLEGTKIAFRFDPRDPTTVYVKAGADDWITAEDINLSRVAEPFAAATWAAAHRSNLTAITNEEARERSVKMAKAITKAERQEASNRQVMAADAHLPRVLDERLIAEEDDAVGSTMLDDPSAFAPYPTSASEEW